ncbi:hypothetical protein D3C77_640520 [compost metagenome]
MFTDLWLGIGGVAEDGAAWPLLCAFFSAYGLGELIAIDARHVAVKNQHVVWLPPPKRQAIQAIVGTAVRQPQVVQLLGHQ